MLDCTSGKCDPASDEEDPEAICGTKFAIPYFVSFYVLCSFLVSGGRERGRKIVVGKDWGAPLRLFVSSLDTCHRKRTVCEYFFLLK